MGILLVGLGAALFSATPAVGVSKAEETRPSRQRVEVEDVLSTSDGQSIVVLKTQKEPLRYLPIVVGEAEALAIRMRLARTKPPRPLTLNLLESVLVSSNIKLVEISIDALEGSVFLGRLRLQQNGRSWDLDARPSDAIGLALGRGAGIYVTEKVLEEAGIDAKELDKERKEKTPAPAPPSGGLEETL